MPKGILVFVEQRNGQVRKASLEALSEGRRKSDHSGEPMYAVIVGNNVQGLTSTIAKYKPNKIYVVDGAAFENYSTEGYAAALSEAIKKADPKYIFAGHSAMVKELVPRVAARMDIPVASDVVELIEDGGNLSPIRPMYSGKTWGVIEFQSTPAFITLRPNAFWVNEPDENHKAEIETLDISPDIKAKVVETHVSEGQKVELSEARIIVSGGRGIKGPENWPMLQDLCDVLGAALGASRAVVDAGWIDHQHQVGQTGKTVSPQLYIAVGISGAIQHLAGMSSSKVIVAINKDKEAPIFKYATYGLVGDVFEILPKLTEECRKLTADM